jgi:type IV pilus assembly protein PilB
MDSSLSTPTAPVNTLLDLLVADSVITKEQAEKLRVDHLSSGGTIETVIRNSGLVDEEKLAHARAKFYNVPFVDLTEKATSPESLNTLTKLVAQRYRVLPFDLDVAKGELSLAMANFLDLEAIEFVEKKTGLKVRPYAGVPHDIDLAIDEKYDQSLSAEVNAALKETSIEETRTIDIKKLGEIIREAPIAKIVSTLLEFAMRSKASDIHIEPQENKTRVRYRIDGILHEKLVLPKKVHEAVVSRIKIVAGMKIDEKRIPQDGRFNFKAGEDEVDLRVSSLPTSRGEKIVMRLLKKSGNVPTLPELGIRGLALKNLEDAILRPHGIIVVCGPTGSGKTTTLYAVLSKINTTRVNIVTLEDPVEYAIPGVNQVQVNSQAGLTFASGLRSFLRQDPNIILVGEIRDSETADLAIQASLTGHLVFSTLHTNDAAGAIPRLLDMGAEPFLLASSVTSIVAQRIVRKVCDNCKKPYSPSPEAISDIKAVLGKLKDVNNDAKLYKGEGCAQCNDTGYVGRMGIFEIIKISEKVAKLILERSPASAIAAQAIDEGMITMKQDGYLKALEGISTIEEVIRVAQD